jgi:hypothetical protein
MYYSKNASQNINLPRNYSGNTFRVIDESERHYIKEQSTPNEEKDEILSTKIEEKETKKEVKNSILPSFFSDISVEDLLLLGLMLVIHQENPNDTTLLLLLILLLAK